MMFLKQLLSAGIFILSQADAYDLRNVIPSSTTQNLGPVPTAPSALPARDNSHVGIWTPAALRAMMKEREEYEAAGMISELQKRDQYIFATCPEAWPGTPPKACSDCGGNSRTPGLCDQILLTGNQRNCIFEDGCGVYCRCLSDGVDITPGKITSFTTVNGNQAGTVVYEPLTLSEYSGLRASTTVTVTDLVATSTDGSSGMATFVVVAVAGGIAWWAAQQFGAVAAIEAIQPPSQLPEDGKEDDEVCKRNPKEDCADCGGADHLKLCSSGPEAGCPCDENQHCPDEPPRCTDADCGGDNGKSQCSASGPINGCTCCPSDIISCSDNKCNGDQYSSCQADTYHGCGCLWFADDGRDVVGQNGDPSSITPDELSSQVAAIFTTAWGAVSSNVPGLPKAPTTTSCPYASFTPTTSLNTGTASVTFLPVTNCFCNCGGSITPLYWGTNSAHSTSSWCMQGTSIPASYTFVQQGCEPTASASTTTSPATTTTSPPVNTPPPNTTCNKDSDCKKWTCKGGAAAKCVSGQQGDPLNKICQC